jgi:hypothetical protein
MSIISAYQPGSGEQNVCVQTMGGRTLEVELKKDSLVQDLKQFIFEEWRVPAESQKLAVGDSVPFDFDPIGSIAEEAGCTSGTPLLVTLVTTKEVLPSDRCSIITSIISRLTSSDSRARQNAVSALAKVMNGDSERELEFFLAQVNAYALLHQDVGPKRAGLEAVAKVSPKGHEASIRAVMPCLEERRELVKLTAMETLATIAPRGHESTIQAAKRLVRSKNTRAAGTMILGEVATQDTPQIFDMMAKLQEDEDEGVRIAAMEASMRIFQADA